MNTYPSNWLFANELVFLTVLYTAETNPTQPRREQREGPEPLFLFSINRSSELS